jgi:hypothetical protein
MRGKRLQMNPTFQDLRNDYCQLTKEKVRNPKPVTFVSLELMRDVILEKSGLRQINHVT